LEYVETTIKAKAEAIKCLEETIIEEGKKLTDKNREMSINPDSYEKN
jgi:hypothetical protein